MDGVCSAESRAKFEDQNLEGNLNLLIEVKNELREYFLRSLSLTNEVIKSKYLSDKTVLEKCLNLSCEPLSVMKQIPEKVLSNE